METVGKLRSIIASVRNGIELGDTVETLEWCADTIERLQKENVQIQTSSVIRIRSYVELCSKLSDDQGNLIAELYDQISTLTGERDAARAEVESLKKQIGGLEYHLNAARAR